MKSMYKEPQNMYTEPQNSQEEHYNKAYEEADTHNEGGTIMHKLLGREKKTVMGILYDEAKKEDKEIEAEKEDKEIEAEKQAKEIEKEKQSIKMYEAVIDRCISTITKKFNLDSSVQEFQQKLKVDFGHNNEKTTKEECINKLGRRIGNITQYIEEVKVSIGELSPLTGKKIFTLGNQLTVLKKQRSNIETEIVSIQNNKNYLDFLKEHNTLIEKIGEDLSNEECIKIVDEGDIEGRELSRLDDSVKSDIKESLLVQFDGEIFQCIIIWKEYATNMGSAEPYTKMVKLDKPKRVIQSITKVNKD